MPTPEHILLPHPSIPWDRFSETHAVEIGGGQWRPDIIPIDDGTIMLADTTGKSIVNSRIRVLDKNANVVAEWDIGGMQRSIAVFPDGQVASIENYTQEHFEALQRDETSYLPQLDSAEEDPRPPAVITSLINVGGKRPSLLLKVFSNHGALETIAPVAVFAHGIQPLGEHYLFLDSIDKMHILDIQSGQIIASESIEQLIKSGNITSNGEYIDHVNIYVDHHTILDDGLLAFVMKPGGNSPTRHIVLINPQTGRGESVMQIDEHISSLTPLASGGVFFTAGQKDPYSIGAIDSSGEVVSHVQYADKISHCLPLPDGNVALLLDSAFTVFQRDGVEGVELLMFNTRYDDVPLHIRQTHTKTREYKRAVEIWDPNTATRIARLPARSRTRKLGYEPRSNQLYHFVQGAGDSPGMLHVYSDKPIVSPD